MKYWKMKLTCQSPVHIGSGDSYKKNQYLYEDNGRKAKIYFLNESKWAVFLDRGKLTNHLVDEINRDPKYFSLYDFLSCHYPKKNKSSDSDISKKRCTVQSENSRCALF